jgi:hypothetical protein
MSRHSPDPAKAARNTKDKRKAYKPPKLVEYGHASRLTAGTGGAKKDTDNALTKK